MRDIIYGVIGGLIGAGVWAGVAYVTEYEIGWIAWGIGGLVGYAVAAGNQDTHRPPVAAGVIAVVITALSIAGGKLGAIQLMMPSDAEIVELFVEGFDDEEYVMSFVADDVVTEFQEAGRPLEWPELADLENPASAGDYPADVWAETTTRWEAMSEQERTAFREAREAESRANVEESLPEIRALMGQTGFFASFTPMDLLFFGLGMVTAWGIGSGQKTKEEIAAAYQSALLLSMLQVMLADGEVDDGEVGAIQNVFNGMTGGELDPDTIRQEAERISGESINLVGALEEMSPHLTPEQREGVVRAAVQVAMADGSVEAEEQQLIGEIANAVDVSAAHLRGIISHLTEQQ